MKTSDGLYVGMSLLLPFLVVCAALGALFDWLGMSDNDVVGLGLVACLLVSWWQVRRTP